jgi:hypothetical protein
MRLLTAAVALVCAAAVAAPFTAGASEDTPVQPLDREEYTGVPVRDQVLQTEMDKDETVIQGRVTNGADVPLPDVSLKLFVGGLRVGQTRTDGDGEFEFRTFVDYTDPPNTTLWVVPLEERYLLKQIPLVRTQTGRVLESPCNEAVTLNPLTRISVVLQEEQERLESLQAKGCLDLAVKPASAE